MHGTGNFPCLSTLAGGGSIVTMDNRTFDPVDLLDTIEREGVNSMAMVGDAFGRPVLRTLDENPGRWDLTSLVAIVSSGVMWSKETKEGLLDLQRRSDGRHGESSNSARRRSSSTT